MGTLLLTRSFTLDASEESEENENQAAMEDVGNTSGGSGMNVDGAHEQDPEKSEEQLDGDEEETEGIFVALTPLADMLNGSRQNNVCKLFLLFPPSLPLNRTIS